MKGINIDKVISIDIFKKEVLSENLNYTDSNGEEEYLYAEPLIIFNMQDCTKKRKYFNSTYELEEFLKNSIIKKFLIL